MRVVLIISCCAINTIVEPFVVGNTKVLSFLFLIKASNRPAAAAKLVHRWDINEPMEYSFDGLFTTREQNFINLALEYWRNGTCLDFELRDDEPHWNRVVFQKSSRCDSMLGPLPGNDVQYVNLDSICSVKVGYIAHEIGHLLGLHHIHQRADRDNFVEINWNNIEDAIRPMFDVTTNSFFDLHEIPYDFGSVMHYVGYRRDNQWTQSIRTKMEAYQLTIGDKNHLSFYDLKAVNLIHECGNLCSNQLACQRNGFINSRTCDSCWCPEGFTGKLCEKTMPSVGRQCGGTATIKSSYVGIGTPGWPHWPREKLGKGQECTWLLKAAEKKIIEFRFARNPKKFLFTKQFLSESLENSWFETKNEKNYCEDYVEVKDSSDLANTGMRFCGYFAPSGPMYSETNEMMVLFRSRHGRSLGFGAMVKAIDPQNRSNEAFEMIY